MGIASTAPYRTSVRQLVEEAGGQESDLSLPTKLYVTITTTYILQSL